MTDGRTKFEEVGLMARAFFVMFLPVKVRPLVDADYADEVVKNPGFGQQAAPELAKWTNEYSKAVKTRATILRGGLFKSLLVLLFGVVLGIIILNYWTPTQAAKAWLGVGSVFCFAWSTLARLGKPGRSIGGTTAIERLDQLIFWFLYWLGMLFCTLALL